MADFGISVSANGISNQGATVPQTVLTSKYPLAKMDRTKPSTLQNIRIFFATEPPVGGGGTTTTTLLYSFPHTYGYTPSIWAFGRADGVTGSFITGGTTYFLDSGLINGDGTGPGSYSRIFTGADATNCYVYISKYFNGIDSGTFVAGSAITIRFDVFVEDLGNPTA